MNARLAVALSFLTVAGCTKSPTPATADPAPAPSAAGASATAVDRASLAARGERGEQAEIGKPAPDFALKDLDGTEVRLSQLRGKTVVLEWFNPGCPFVKASHTKGSLNGTAKRVAATGVVWLAINSGAPGKQGAGVEANTEGKRKFGLEHPILLDETGDVGHRYGATNTPHMFVIDPKGTLVYRGAIDNSPDGEGDSPTGGKLVNYVDAALADVAHVAVSSTKAYGCSVKYASR